MRAFKTLFTTFFSYKGGVGRTSALVNTALLRAISGDRVVVIDFDFEAPGVSSYVKELARINNKKVDLDTRPGILEYLYDSINLDIIPSLKSRAITSKDLGLNIEGDIWFIGAGNTSDPKYSHKFSSLNWPEIFEKNQGELILRNLKKQINSEFGGPDHVFIDSRTGISEIGGVCTRYLADSVVVLSSLNDQNLLGTSKVYDTFKKSDLHTILVASNVPVGLPWGSEQLFCDRINKFKDNFSKQPDLLIYHYPSLSLMEYLPAFFKIKDNESVLKEDPLLRSYEALSDKIDSDNANSFNKFLSELINKLFAFNSEKEDRAEEHLKFFSKHYSHRVVMLETLNLLKSVRDTLSLEKRDEIVKEETINNLIKLKDLKSNYEDSSLSMLIEYTLDNASDKIVSYYNSTPSEITNNLGWFDVLSNSATMEAISVLIKNQQYKELFKKLSTKKERLFIIFAQGLISEKLGKAKESKEYYRLFANHIDEPIPEIEYPGVSFALAYALAKLGDIENSKLSIKRTLEIIGSEEHESTFYFIPMRFELIKDSEEFAKEILAFQVSLTN